MVKKIYIQPAVELAQEEIENVILADSIDAIIEGSQSNEDALGKDDDVFGAW